MAAVTNTLQFTQHYHSVFICICFESLADTLCVLQGTSIVEQLDVSGGSESAIYTQSTQESALTIEAKLKHMHDFLSNYMPNTTVEE